MKVSALLSTGSRSRRRCYCLTSGARFLNIQPSKRRRTSSGRSVDTGTPVELSIDGKRFSLVAGGADAWAPDSRSDAAIVAAMRAGQRMSISAMAKGTGRFADSYLLKGAATAIDAAALGCARRR